MLFNNDVPIAVFPFFLLHYFHWNTLVILSWPPSLPWNQMVDAYLPLEKTNSHYVWSPRANLVWSINTQLGFNLRHILLPHLTSPNSLNNAWMENVLRGFNFSERKRVFFTQWFFFCRVFLLYMQCEITNIPVISVSCWVLQFRFDLGLVT